MLGLEEIYNQAAKILRNIVEDIRFGRKLYFKPIERCSIEICTYLNDETNIWSLHSIHQNKHPYMYSHPVNVAFLSFAIGKWMELDYVKLEKLVLTALLHDIGKSKIKDSLLNKVEPLTSDEMERMKSHPVIGYKILDCVKKFDMEVLQGVLFHHESMDGTGYPLGIQGDKINLFSRIIAIADTYDAYTANTAYGQKMTPLKAIEEIHANIYHRLDQYICDIFAHNIIDHYIGSTVRLSNEKLGNIVSMNPRVITRPLIRCEHGEYDLSVEGELEILEFL